MKPTSTSNGLNSLVKGTMVEGTINSDSDIRIDGKIKGKLICDSKVIIGPSGEVEGEIDCLNAVIEGKFEGKLNVKELLNVRESAAINGEVNTNKLIVQSGAVFNVSCTMGGVKKTASIIDKTIMQKDSGKTDGPAKKTGS